MVSKRERDPFRLPVLTYYVPFEFSFAELNKLRSVSGFHSMRKSRMCRFWHDCVAHRSCSLKLRCRQTTNNNILSKFASLKFDFLHFFSIWDERHDFRDQFKVSTANICMQVIIVLKPTRKLTPDMTPKKSLGIVC